MDGGLKRYVKKLQALRGDERLEKLEWLPGNCNYGICGEEAACIPGDSRHKCVCPSDLSAPTKPGLLCLNRRIVPFTPRPIFNINVMGGSARPSNNSSTSNQQEENTNENKNDFHPAAGFVIGLLSFVLILSVLTGALLWWKKKCFLQCTVQANRRKKNEAGSPINLNKLLQRSQINNPGYETADAMPIPTISIDNLVFIEELGEGNFGKVFKGELKKEDGTTETVAIKLLKDTATKIAEEDFMIEVEIMSSFHHKNILALIGIVLGESNTRPWMVFEFMLYGDLAEVLRCNSQQFWKEIPGLERLTKQSLLKIAIQIASGMQYLASQRFVHNDLACRNCLVGSDLIIKIADFGMSRDIYTCDYYRLGGHKPVPVRWMSPESIMYRKFTLESDIWSYGVVLWEIYSLGKQPYYGLSNEEAMENILRGVLLEPPETCPYYIRKVMLACWKIDPKHRMEFSEIQNFFKIIWNKKITSELSGTSPDSSTFSDDITAVVINEVPILEVPLPRPPLFPPQTEFRELDADSYLTPQTSPANDYLQPLPE